MTLSTWVVSYQIKWLSLWPASLNGKRSQAETESSISFYYRAGTRWPFICFGGVSRRDLAALDAALNTWVESFKKSLCCFNTRFWQGVALNLRSCTHPTLLKLEWWCLLTLSSHKHVIFASYLIHKLDGLYCHQYLDYSSPGVCSFKQDVNNSCFAKFFPVPVPLCPQV